MLRLRRTLGSSLAVALVTGLAHAPGSAAAGQPTRPDKAVIPISADLVFTNTTVDSAGQRHTSTETQRYYRDSHGRTRTEAGSIVTLSDPVTRTTTTLNVGEVPAGFRSIDPFHDTGSRAGVQSSCPIGVNYPLVINSVGSFLASGTVTAVAGPAATFPGCEVQCWFTADWAEFEYPLDGYPLFSVPFLLDFWDVYDTGGWVPTLPYVAFGYIGFTANPILPVPGATVGRFTTEVVLLIN